MSSGSKQSVFRNSALTSGLITQQQIDEALLTVREDSSENSNLSVDVDDNVLAAKLVEMDNLTEYQAEQLKAGKTRLHLGPYTITDFIGQGGMGHVFKAVHNVLGRVSAVKVLPHEKSTPEAIASFTREIRMQAGLDHQNLVRAYDAGHDGNVHYLVVEYVPGTDLRKFVREHRRLTMQQAANIIMQAARGLAHAHQRKLIHRDVKPGNILVTPEGIAKVSDLGLAGFTYEGEDDPRSGKIMGTADYLSPEQIRTPKEVTEITDIYSLGCTLYYAITGKVPFPGGTPSNKAKRHLEETPWHPRRFNSDVNEEFVDIIADMMEKDPKDRIQTATEVASRLEPWASESGPISTQHLGRSPWMPPPLPIDLEDESAKDIGLAGMEYSDSGYGEGGSGGSGQVSQGTDPNTSVGQETRSLPPKTIPIPPPILSLRDTSESRNGSRLAIALAIAIPVALLIGGAIGFGLTILIR